MSSKSNQIGELLNISSAAAPDVTKSLKSIGDGNMLEGVRNIFDYALMEGNRTGIAKGEIQGIVKGSVFAFCVCGVLYLIPKGVKYFNKQVSGRKSHDEMGEKIYSAFSEELSVSPNEGDFVDEEDKNSEA